MCPLSHYKFVKHLVLLQDSNDLLSYAMKFCILVKKMHETYSLRSGQLAHFYIDEGIVQCPHCQVDIATHPPNMNSSKTSCSTILTKNKTCQVVWMFECGSCNQLFKVNILENGTTTTMMV